MFDYTVSLLLYMSDDEVYQPCYQSTLLTALQQRCGYSTSTSCR